MKEKRKTFDSPDYNDVIEGSFNNFLILHNDDINTFDYVIESLVEVCDHDIEQAEQCTYIVHYNGKCDVKKGNYSILKPLKEELLRRGLSATID